MTIPNPDSKRRASNLTAEAAVIFHQGRYEEALALFDLAISFDADNARALAGRGLALAQLGQSREGLVAAMDVTYRYPGYSPGYVTLGLCLQRLGRKEEAREAYERALTIDPNQPSVLYNFACYWAEIGDEEKCRDVLARALAVVEDHTLDHARFDPDLARFATADWFKDLLAEAKQNRARKKTV